MVHPARVQQRSPKALTNSQTGGNSRLPSLPIVLFRNHEQWLALAFDDTCQSTHRALGRRYGAIGLAAAAMRLSAVLNNQNALSVPSQPLV